MSNHAILLCLLSLCIPQIADAQDTLSGPSIRFDPVNGQIVVSSAAFNKSEATSDLTLTDRSRSLCVRLLSLDNGPSVLGKTTIDDSGKAIVFKPRFSFPPGVELSVECDLKTGDRIKLGKVSIPKKSLPVTSVVKVYPTRTVLPENLLKLYVHFSAPMQRGQVYDHIKIVEVKTGTTIELPFLELEQELWSRDGKRLTLLFDPGRIKRGLRPREEMGPIFVAGNEYRFVISKNWVDANGTPLDADYEKKMTIAPNDATSPSVKRWRIETPKNESRDPLTIGFDKTLDSAIAKRAIQVFQGERQLEFNMAELIQDERGLRLFPKEAWTNGNYEIRIDSDLEDLCGNRIGRLFDVDLNNTQRGESSSSNKLVFSIK